MKSLYSLLRLPLEYRRNRRFRQILLILARHGFGDVAHRLGLRGLALFSARFRDRDRARESLGRRLRLTFEELGPTFIKLGQMLAGRPDLLPRQITDELALLQDSVPPLPFSRLKERLESRLGGPVREVFAEFDEVPLAAASIAQVHRAVLRDGREVALKIRRPGIRRRVEEDLAVMRLVAAQVQAAVPELADFDLPALVDEFGRSLRRELDFLAEAANLERFRRNHAGEEALVLPQVYPELSCKDLLVMEFVRGLKLSELERWPEQGIDRRKVAQVGQQVMLSSIFEHRFFHADPHPGNYFVLEGSRLCLLDFGMMGTVSQRRLDQMLGFLAALLSGDTTMMVKVLRDADLVPASCDRRVLEKDLSDLLERVRDARLGDLDVQGLLGNALEIMRRHRVLFPADLLLMGRALAAMESAALAIDPEMKPLETLRPYITAVFLRRAADPQLLAEQLVEGVEDWEELARALPGELRTLLGKAARGQLSLAVKDADFGPREEGADRRVNRALVAGLSAVAFGSWVYLLSVPAQVPALIIWADLALALVTLGWTLLGIWKSGGV
jgi:ubiquinone biosynthesis protein